MTIAYIRTYSNKQQTESQKNAIKNKRNCKTGCSAVRLAHLLWEQGVPGSNPGTPT